VKGFTMEPTKVQWSIGYTMNTGNFQSLRLDCQVNDFVREGETTKDASDRVYAFVESQLVEKLNEAKKELS
jgi:hypothetical protein